MALYLYCLAKSKEDSDLGEIGIEKNKVYCITLNGISAVIHNCEEKPYQSEDKEKVEKWLLSHQFVIDAATKKFGTVIPFTFDTMIKSENELKKWMEKNTKEFRELLEKLENKAEYLVQIYIYPELFKKQMEKDEEIVKLKEGMEKKQKGMAFMIQQKIDMLIKNKIEMESEKYANKFHEEIKSFGIVKHNDLKNPPEKYKDKKMILNLSCLIENKKVEECGYYLEKINRGGFLVRFSGPWAPFSFVGEIK